MEAASQINRPLHLSHRHSPFTLKPVKNPLKIKLTLKASFCSLASNPRNHLNKPPLEVLKPPSSLSSNPQRQLIETLKPLLSLLNTTCIAIATASLFFFCSFPKRSIAAPVAQPIVESVEETTSDEEKERILEEILSSNPEDINALRTLMEIKLKDQKLLEAVSIVDRMIQIEPSEKQWRLLRAHLHSYSGDIELAKLGFEEIISDDPLFVEAYHGLAMMIPQSESGELDTLLKRIGNAMQQCKNEKRKEDLRDFKILVAQVRFIQGNYGEALKGYQDLVKEEPRDFRPYLYQGIIYTLLRQTSEAKKQFEKYQRLVPKDHPYARYFEDNVMATKAFTQVIGSQITSSKE